MGGEEEEGEEEEDDEDRGTAVAHSQSPIADRRRGVLDVAGYNVCGEVSWNEMAHSQMSASQ